MVTKQIPAGTANDAAPDVWNGCETGAAPAGPDPAANAATPTRAIAAAPRPAPATRNPTGTPPTRSGRAAQNPQNVPPPRRSDPDRLWPRDPPLV